MHRLALALTLILSVATLASAATRSVSTTGTDSGTCISSPCATIQYAYNQSSAGDTISVADGTYAASMTLTGHSGTSAYPITIRAANKWGAKLVPSSPSNGGILVVASDVSYVIVRDFEMYPASGYRDSFSYAVRVVGSYVSVIGNKLHGIDNGTSSCNSGGVISTSSGPGNNIDANLIYDSSPSRSWATRCNKMHGLYIQSSNTSITNNIIWGIWQGFAIQLAGSMSNVVVTNNLIFNSGDSRSSYSQSVTGGAIYHECYSGSTCANRFANNIFMEIDTPGGVCIQEATDVGSYNGSVYTSNVTSHCSLFYWATSSLTNNATSVTLKNYQSDGSGDYHPVSTSSSIVDTGSATSAPGHDYDGNSRPLGSGYDRGPYEYVATAPDPAITGVILRGGARISGGAKVQ